MPSELNSLLCVWNTPYGAPPFDQIETAHFTPALEQAFEVHTSEIDKIASRTEAPTFENTIVALELSGRLLDRVSRVFFTLAAAQASDELRAVESRIAPRITAHYSSIFTRPDLYSRVNTVFSGDRSALTAEQRQLLMETHKEFIRSGAALPDASREEIIGLDEELSRLETQFNQNVLKDSNQFELVLETDEDLQGLPESARDAAAREATDRGYAGKYVFTISRSSITPFLQFSNRRDLREKLWKAYIRCANNGNEFDNKEVVTRIAALRTRRARMLGYNSHANYVLDNHMAKAPAAVHALLDQIWESAQLKVREEAADLQARIDAEGGAFKVEPWDWWYYTEKLRAARYSLNAEALSPYFKLENVRDGAFAVANRLYGLRFVPQHSVPVYHEDVQVFEVRDRDDSFIGLFLADYFMRPSKRSGAWMNAMRQQCNLPDRVRPIVFNVCNFVKSEPSLLGLEEVRTVFHEFGHALHGLLSNVAYHTLAGTNVKRDFVELPSQIMEHWATEPEVLKSYARHHQTGETIPDALIDKILATRTFNQGFATTEYLAACYLDLKWHDAREDETKDVCAFERQAMQGIKLVDKVEPRYHSTYFQHIFGGGYSAGYYSYIWAEVLDSDAYQMFKERGIFDPETATSFRTNILERGSTADPMELYVKFRGRTPDVAPLLKNRGL